MQRRIHPRPRFYVFIIVLMLFCFAVSGAVSQLHYNRVERRVGSLSNEWLALSERVNMLNEQLDYVRTDAYVERIARDELNMIMPGEIRYIAH